MRKRIVIGALTGLVLLTIACGKHLNDQDAIRASIDKHLTEQAGLNLSAMDREVKNITVNGNTADAQVEFRVKGGDASMQVQYSMQKDSSGWKVMSSKPMPGMGAHPGSDGPPASGDSMPQGHPPVN